MKRLMYSIPIALFVIALAATLTFLLLNRQARLAAQTSPQLPPNPDQSHTQLDIIAPFTYSEVSSIRSIDFYSFTYPGSTYGELNSYYPEVDFTLVDGKWGDWRDGLTLNKVIYADITEDGEEEAILDFDQETEGSAAQDSVYIYTVENRQPKLLWLFMSGDRSDGGLRRVYAKRGKLVIELYGKETQIEGNSATRSTEFTGLCCPRSITRTHYQWRNGRFQQYGKMEVLPYRE